MDWSADKVLKKYGMHDAKSVNTPVETGTKLIKSADGDQSFDQNISQSAVGCLLYLSTSTRPNLAFAVGKGSKGSILPFQSLAPSEGSIGFSWDGCCQSCLTGRQLLS